MTHNDTPPPAKKKGRPYRVGTPTTRFSVRLTATELATLDATAALYGVDRSELIRRLLAYASFCATQQKPISLNPEESIHDM